jgi:ATP-dependent Clp protease adapter protein ClpS
MALTSYDISPIIIDQIESLSEWRIIVYNNDVTPFNLVFYVLKTVVPMSDQDAFDKTQEIHSLGMAVVYSGNKKHCEKIKYALDQIKVECAIES